jgi:hypothetical protein
VLASGRGGANSKRFEKKLGLVQNVLSFLRIETAEDFRRTLEKIPDYKIRPETVSHKNKFSEKPCRIKGLSSRIILFGVIVWTRNTFFFNSWWQHATLF